MAMANRLESVAGAKAYRDTVAQTHWVAWPAEENGRQARAVCGAWVDPGHVSAEPTCPDCKAKVEDDNAVDPEALLNAPLYCVSCQRERPKHLIKTSPRGRSLCVLCLQTPKGREEWRR